MFTLYAVTNWISAIIFAVFGFFLWLRAQAPSARIFALVSLALAVWSIGVGFFVSGVPDQTAVLLSRFNHFAGSLVGPLFLIFALLYPEEERSVRGLTFLFILLEILFAYPFITTDLVVYDSFAHVRNGIQLGWNFGPYSYLFYLNFLVPFFLGFLVLFRKRILLAGTPYQERLTYLLWGTALGALPGMVVNVGLPFFGSFDYSWLGPAFTINWVAITAYTIWKYHALSVKAATSILLVLFLIVLLFVNIFIP